MFIGQIICVIVLMAVYTAKSCVVASNVTICTAIPNTGSVIARIDRKIVWIIVAEIGWCPGVCGMTVATIGAECRMIWCGYGNIVEITLMTYQTSLSGLAVVK